MSSLQEVTAEVVEAARELESDVEVEAVAEWLQSPDTTSVNKELLLMDAQRKWCLEVEFIPASDVENIVEKTTKDLEYHISLVAKAAAEFKRSDSNFERHIYIGKMLSNGSTCYREIFLERKNHLVWQTLLMLRNCQQGTMAHICISSFSGG
jgi:hypothetical protein